MACEMVQGLVEQVGASIATQVRLRANKVIYRFAHFELGPVSFEASSGELVAIIGPNGAGKSTLLEIISGHLKPLAGCVLLDGEDVHRLALPLRAQRVGLARQDTPLLFAFTVREFVRQGRHPHLKRSLFESSEDERWVEWAMEKTRLRHLASRRVTEISGGEFQRAVLARTLAQRPQLVLLDEPTANLDIGYQMEMLRLVSRLAAAEGFAAVIVSHELNLAAELADYVILVEAGKSLCQGPPGQVFHSELLTRVFRTPVVVDANPASGRPRITWVVPQVDTPARA